MLYVRVELWPFGVKERAVVLGEGKISNVGRSAPHYNEYASEFWHTHPDGYDETMVGPVHHYPRTSYGAWELVGRALQAARGQKVRQSHDWR